MGLKRGGPLNRQRAKHERDRLGVLRRLCMAQQRRNLAR